MKEKSRTHPAKQIARERIAILFNLAEAAFAEDPGRSDRYVALARRISMRQRVRIPREFRRRFCHHCAAFLVPGANMRVRVHRGMVVVTCRACKGSMRYRVRSPHD
jgi:ribonuclease P protein subunit RPR2